MRICYSIKKIYVDLLQVLGKPWMQYLWLFLITLLAAALRFYKLGEWSFWIDEIFTINHAAAHFSTFDLVINNIPPARNWIPVSVMLTAQVLNILEINELNTRFVAVIFGIITVPVLFFIVRKLFNTRVALIASLFLALSTWHIEWSQNTRFYTALLLFYILALTIYYFGIEKDRPLYIVVFMFLLYLAASERFFAVFIIPVILVYILLLKILPFEKPPGLRIRNILLTILPVLAAIIIEIVSYIMDGTFRFLGGFDWFFLYQIYDPLRLLSFISFDVGVSLMCFSAFVGIYLVYKKSRPGLLLLINAVVPVVLLLSLNLVVFTKTRYIFMTLPSWIILGAVGIVEVLNETKSQRKILALGLLFVLLTDFASSNLLYYQVNNGNRHNWKGAFSIVNQTRIEGDEVVTSWPQWEGFYWDKAIVKWESLSPEIVISSGNRYWFILDEEIIWGNMEMKSWIEKNAELKDVLYLRREDEYYLKIYLFDPAPKVSLLE